MYKTVAVIVFLLGCSPAYALVAGNQSAGRDLQVQDGVLRTVSIHNEITKQAIPVDSDEFRLSIDGLPILTAKDFTAVSSTPGSEINSDKQNSTGAAEYNLKSEKFDIALTIRYTADVNKPYLRKTIRVTNLSQSPRLLRWIEVERFTANNETLEYSANPAFSSLTDYGQPVLLDSFWIGLEHPAANTAKDATGTVFLRHHPGKQIKQGETFESFPAVIGVSAKGASRQAFEEYVLQLKYYPGNPRVFFWWNGFRVIKPPERLSQGLLMVDCLLNRLQKPFGPVFEGFSYDAGFDMYQPEGFWVPREESLWPETARILKDSHTKLGFWASFSCIYDTNTHPWGKTQGYGLQHPAAYCLAEPTYHQAAKKRLLDIVKTNDMRVISFDGMYLGQGYGCNTPGHGHLVSDDPAESGKYGTEAVANAELDIFHALREIQPNINIDFFVCNEWVSPWWLTVVDGVHSVPGDTVGTHILSPALRDELITARDIQAFELHRNQRRPFPLWAEDLYGFQVRKDHIIDGITANGEDHTEKWENEYVLGYAGRGTITSFIACCDLLLLEQTKSGLKFLADVNRWVRANNEIYLHTNFILGDPNQGEVCGYAHGNRENRSLIALHNPDIQTRRVSIRIDKQLDLPESNQQYKVNVIYPYRASLGIKKWNDVITLPMHGYEVTLVDIRRDDLKSPEFSSSENQEYPSPELQSVAVNAQEKHLTFTTSITIPQSHTNPELLVYLRPGIKIEYTITCRINGKEKKASVRSRSRADREEAWFCIPLENGANKIEAELAAADTNQLGIWCSSELSSGKLTTSIQSGEMLFPILPDGLRHQYWQVYMDKVLIKP